MLAACQTQVNLGLKKLCWARSHICLYSLLQTNMGPLEPWKFQKSDCLHMSHLDNLSGVSDLETNLPDRLPMPSMVAIKGLDGPGRAWPR